MVDDPVTAYIFILSVMSVLSLSLYIYTSIYPIVIIMIMYKLISTMYIYIYIDMHTQKSIISYPTFISHEHHTYSLVLSLLNVPQYPEDSVAHHWACHLWVKARPATAVKGGVLVVLRCTRPGEHTKSYGKSPFLMGKSTISTGPFSIAMLDRGC